MPCVQSQVVVNAPLPRVWELAKDSENFPSIMEDVDAVHILEQEAISDTVTRVVSEWHGRIAAFNRKVKWIEEEFWNQTDYTCTFKQLKGDFTDYSGLWSFKPTDAGVLIDLSIEYLFEVPMIGPLINKVVLKLMKNNCDNMLTALKTEAERTSAFEH